MQFSLLEALIRTDHFTEYWYSEAAYQKVVYRGNQWSSGRKGDDSLYLQEKMWMQAAYALADNLIRFFL